MTAIFWLLDAVLGFYLFVIIASVILSWLTLFGIINSYQPFVRTITDILNALTEPLLNHIRRFMPRLNGVDLSPLVLYFLVYALRILLRYDIAPLFGVVI